METASRDFARNDQGVTVETASRDFARNDQGVTVESGFCDFAQKDGMGCDPQNDERGSRASQSIEVVPALGITESENAHD